MHWLNAHARMAVQVFLVLGGYLAAAALAPQGQGRHAQFWSTLSKRFVRLSLPYSAALLIAIVVIELVRNAGFEHPSVSATPTWGSVLAHLLLLHSMAGFESISAGVWYVAIDFQLYALCLLWFWWCQRSPRSASWGPTGIVLATAASLWIWNLNPALDIWALYFIGAYGLGMMAWWATHSSSPAQRWRWIGAMAALAIMALTLAWRDRIALASASALALAIGGNLRWPAAVQHFQITPLTWIGQRSYSIFLIHFPMSLLVNATVHTLWPGDVVANSLGLLAAVLLSIAAGAALFEWTERRSATWQHLQRWQLGALSTGWAAAGLQWL